MSKTAVEDYGRFEIIAQTPDNQFLINTGVAYDGYGNRLFSKDRTLISLEFPSGLNSDSGGSYGFLAVRRKQQYRLIDFMDDPLTGLPHKAKYDVEIEFYIVAGVLAVTIGTTTAVYPPLDDNLVIPGIILGKVYLNAVSPPNMISYRSPLLSLRDGVYKEIPGFNLG